MATIQAHFPDLQRAIDAAQLRTLGAQDINDTAHARTMAALLRAYGASERGFLYAEPIIPHSDYMPDLVLAHPETGIIVFEVKAYDLSFIQEALPGGDLRVILSGHEQTINPLKQAQRAMFSIKENIEAAALDRARPLLNAMVALPNISEMEWTAAGHETALARRLVLFAEDIKDLERLRTRIARYVHQTLHLSGVGAPLPPDIDALLAQAFGAPARLAQRPRAARRIPFENLGATIDQIEAEHQNLSAEQQELSRLDTWGHPYLLRGVAGSGKSIVMAYQVARLVLRQMRHHQQLTLFPDERYPMPKIAVVCLNRTLVPLLREYVSAAYRAIAGEDLPAEPLTITHLNGLVYDLAEAHDHFHYVPMKRARDAGERAREFLAQLDTMTEAELDELRFDAIFIDEGQDVHPDALTLLHTLVRPHPKTKERTLSIYYDDAQNIYGHTRPTWRAFGLNVEGGRASFMRECYRNTREILELGLNVLLGTAADEKTRVATRRFADIYTLKEKELVDETPDGWRVYFASARGEAPLVDVFPNRPAQITFAAETLLMLIEDEQVRPEDILVLAPTARPFDHLETALGEMAAAPLNIQAVGGRKRATLDDPLLMPGQLTLSTVYAAKGYDAPVALLLDTDQLARDVVGRAMFYVAATRAKRYLWVMGVKTPDSLLSEAQTIQKRLFPE